MKRLFIFAILLLVLVVASPASGQGSSAAFEIAMVTSVIDGDTIDVQITQGTNLGEFRVRYIGINTPERDEVCSDDATQANRVLVAGKTVVMIRDISNTDKFDRLLRYVFVEGTFVNAALVADGWAEAVAYSPDTTFSDWFEYLEDQARKADIGCHPTGVFAGQSITTTDTDVTVTASNDINLRAGPGTNYPVISTLPAGQTMRAQARNGDWLYLGNGKWIASWVVTVNGNINGLPTHSAPPPPAAAPAAQPPAQPTVPAASAFTCDCSKTCSQMVSCDEAYFQLVQCGCGRRDGDNDGVPCESICPGG